VKQLKSVARAFVIDEAVDRGADHLTLRLAEASSN
jgi:hypothetical protein